VDTDEIRRLEERRKDKRKQLKKIKQEDMDIVNAWDKAKPSSTSEFALLTSRWQNALLKMGRILLEEGT